MTRDGLSGASLSVIFLSQKYQVSCRRSFKGPSPCDIEFDPWLRCERSQVASCRLRVGLVAAEPEVVVVSLEKMSLELRELEGQALPN